MSNIGGTIKNIQGLSILACVIYDFYEYLIGLNNKNLFNNL